MGAAAQMPAKARAIARISRTPVSGRQSSRDQRQSSPTRAPATVDRFAHAGCDHTPGQPPSEALRPGEIRRSSSELRPGSRPASCDSTCHWGRGLVLHYIGTSGGLTLSNAFRVEHKNRAHRRFSERIGNAATQYSRQTTTAVRRNRDQVRTFAPGKICDRFWYLVAKNHVEACWHSRSTDLRGSPSQI